MSLNLTSSDAMPDQILRPERRRFMLVPGVIAVVSALVTGAVSFVVLMGLTPIDPTETVVTIATVVNGALVLVLCGLIFFEVARMARARRQGKAASRLHVRIVVLFAIVAALPALLVAVVAGITLDLGLDRWFEIRTRAIVDSSVSVARAYVNENARNLQGSTSSMAYDLDSQRRLFDLDRTGFEQLVTEQARGRSLLGAQLLRMDGSPIMRADIAVDKPLPAPPEDALKQAKAGNLVFIPPGITNLVGAIVKLRALGDIYLYTVRVVDPEVISALRLMEERTAEYRSLQNNRIGTQIAFALLYLGITLIVLLSAIWTGIGVADRLVRPIRLLISAADEVSAGNLAVSVPVRNSDGDVGSLSNTFNNMIRQLASQRGELLSAKDVIDERRRFTEAVLSGVTVGVIGVEGDGTISMLNPSAERILAISAQTAVGHNLHDLFPLIAGIHRAAGQSRRAEYQEEIKLRTRERERVLAVRVTSEDGDDGQSSVVTIDDITDLVDAQRSSAWADVARRIAHEIKNPLTPIQLSAERIRRRYGKMIEGDREVFDRCVDTIIRQVSDIGRMVDEFSTFARMPKPKMETRDLREALKEAVFMREMGDHGIAFTADFGDVPLSGDFDIRLLSQAFGNLVKNAVESLETSDVAAPRIQLTARQAGTHHLVEILDNGRGFPREDRDRLLEPYMTTREKGTGLGLAIVRKIIEEHGGSIELDDAPGQAQGALVRVRLPAVPDRPTHERTDD
ncbi:PAS domain-containing sensor histidine kinase [Aureimonas sp. Leaf454]|uniref:sensor histidine kinase NtrY-like n=1 Tax=Aureimonas sp. Leaf454 TaxID=1736381 RepID=UPI0006F42116|nr:PAS domain-containing sensor histidine kinase [Aureimonas sp. Leaf454]KQT48692.1 PAS domain-containing sensor histidine kinase [Aureimonas sp. Leaf454]